MKEWGGKTSSWVEVKGIGCPWMWGARLNMKMGCSPDRLWRAHWKVLEQSENANHCNGFLLGTCLPEYQLLLDSTPICQYWKNTVLTNSQYFLPILEGVKSRLAILCWKQVLTFYKLLESKIYSFGRKAFKRPSTGLSDLKKGRNYSYDFCFRDEAAKPWKDVRN